MKRLVSATLALAALAGLAGCYLAAAGYKRSPSLAALDGSLQVEGLNGPVTVYRDDYGVPHIMSEDEHDLFFAVGYVQAQDRLWEMVLLRAVAEGRMAEIFGDVGLSSQEIIGFPLSTTGIDRRQRLMGLNWLGLVGERLLKEKNPEIFNQLQAYADGVNAFIDSHPDYKDLPLEFQLLRIKPGHFRVADVVSQGRFIGSMLCGNLDQELARYALIKKAGPDLAWKLMPLHDSLGPTIVPPELLHNKLDHPRDLPPGGRPSDEELGVTPEVSADAALDIMNAEISVRNGLYVKAPYASNNWIVSGKITENGHAMLANDPHLQHVEPSLFYMMHIKGAGFDAFGVTFPGNPYTVLGHTRRLAWGATTTSADVQDLFVETVDDDHPGQYLYKGEWLPFVERTEEIKVRVGTTTVTRKLKIQQTVHGPIINAMAAKAKDEPPIAMRWAGWDFDRNVKVFEAVVTSSTIDEIADKVNAMPETEIDLMNEAIMCNRLMKGKSIDDFIHAMEAIVVPNQSWVAADADGHIAYLPGGLVPVRGKGIGALPVPGESGDFDWTGFIPLMELPHAIDPERGYMATANNEVVDAEWYPYVFSTKYGSGWRAARIEELINELKPISIEDMVRIQNDILVKQAQWWTPIILKAVERKQPTDPEVIEAARELGDWDFMADLDSTATVIFFRFIEEMTDNVVEDEAPGAHLGGQGANVERWVARGESEFFDDKRTKDVVEDMDDMIVKSLADAMDWIGKHIGKDKEDRRWGKVHYIKFYHPLGLPPLGQLSVGPFPHTGAENTVRNAAWGGFGRDPYKCLGGPVLRHVMDMGDPDRALMMIDGSQSGQWLSPHYDDLHEMFVNGEYIQAVMDPDQVKASARHVLVLEPAR